MKKVYILIAFIIMAMVQLFVPAQMIFQQEHVLTSGKVYKFLTQPLDPNDPFRGKYITLNYKLDAAVTTDSSWIRNDDIYVYLLDSLGYAKIDTIAKQNLQRPTDYVLAKVTWLDRYSNYDNDKPVEVHFQLPFNRFYMEESKAQRAEDVVRLNRRDSLITNVYGLVYVKEGNAVLKDVFIDDLPILDYIKKDADQ